MSTAYTEKKNG